MRTIGMVSCRRLLLARAVPLGAFVGILHIAGTGAAQIEGAQISKVTGIGDTSGAQQAEACTTFSVLSNGGVPTGVIQAITYNDDSEEVPQFEQFTTSPDDRIVAPGYSALGWSFRMVTLGLPTPAYSHAKVRPPATPGLFNPPFDQGVAALWGDPGMAASPPSDPGVVFITSLAIPTRKLPGGTTLRGGLADTAACTPFGGACIARSLDGGASFSIVDCVGETDPSTEICTNSLNVATNGHFYDGGSAAVSPVPEVPNGPLPAWVGFIDDTATTVYPFGGHEAIWKIDDMRSTQARPFHLDTDRTGRLGDLSTLGDIDLHVRLRVDADGLLWKMSKKDKNLVANIRNRNAAPVILAGDLDVDAGSPLVRANTPHYSFDVGLNEAGQKEMRFAYVGSSAGNFYVQGGFCVGDDLTACSLPSEWKTTPVSQHVFFPSLAFGQDPFSHRNVWKVTFRQGTADGRSANVVAGELARTGFDTGTPTAVPIIPVPVIPDEPLCADGRGYWGDYDNMAFNPVTGAFSRPYTDSTMGQCVSSTFEALPMHVSAVDIQGDDIQTVYGGSFQNSDQVATNCIPDVQNNLRAPGLACPEGFEGGQTGRILTPTDGGDQCGANQYACFSRGVLGIPPGAFWGGEFQVEDPSDPNFFFSPSSVENPVTHFLGCPLGYIPHEIGRVVDPETGAGATQYNCEGDSTPFEARWRYGGRFQVVDNFPNCSGSVPNPLTGGLGCPPGYVAAKAGRIKFPEVAQGQCGADQFICVLTLDTSPVDFSFVGMSETVQQPPPGQTSCDPEDDRGAASCPDGFDQGLTGDVLAPEGGCRAFQTTCTAIGVRSDAFQFGGMFQVPDDQDPQHTIVNAQTGQASCPPGYTEAAFGRVLDPDLQIGASQSYCYALMSQSVPTQWQFGGAWQQDSCRSDSQTNPITRTLGCPSGYVAAKFGRAQSWTDGCAVDQYYCFRQVPGTGPSQ